MVQVIGRFNRARAAQLTLPHFVCQTPLFMPVGTQGIINQPRHAVEFIFLCASNDVDSDPGFMIVSVNCCFIAQASNAGFLIFYYFCVGASSHQFNCRHSVFLELIIHMHILSSGRVCCGH